MNQTIRNLLLLCPRDGGPWWLAGRKIDTSNVLEHVELPINMQAYGGAGVAAGQPWSIAFRSTMPPTLSQSAFDSQTGRLTICYSPLGNGWYDTAYRDVGLFTAGDHTYFLICDGTNIQAYRDAVAVGAPVVSAPAIGGTTRWRSRYAMATTYTMWSPELPGAAVYDIALSATQRARLHAAMMRIGAIPPVVGTYIDVSSVLDVEADVVTGCILYLTDDSDTALVRFRDFEASTWYDLDTNITLDYAHTGGNVAIAVISDTHFGRAACDPAACLTAAIDDIDDNIGGVSYVLVLGDIVHDADHFAAYKTVRATSDIAATNWRELAGNHDYAVLATFLSSLGYTDPYHSLTIGNSIFLFVSDDAGVATMSEAEQAWLTAQLAANIDKNVFICTHQGEVGTTRGTSHALGYLLPTAYIAVNVQAAQWCAWFCGHSHGFAGIPAPDSTCVLQV